MIQITPQMRVLVAVDAVDGRKGIDSLAALCREKLQADPFSGWLFVFRTRSAQAIKILCYDGQGFWMAQKRLSKGRFRWWPTGTGSQTLEAHQFTNRFSAEKPSQRKLFTSSNLALHMRNAEIQSAFARFLKFVFPGTEL